MEMPKDPHSRNVVAVLFVLMSICLVGVAFAMAAHVNRMREAPRSDANITNTITEIEVARSTALTLSQTFSSLPAAWDGEYKDRALNNSTQRFNASEEMLKTAARISAPMSQLDAAKILEGYQTAAAMRREAIRERLCEEVVTFVDVDGKAARGEHVARVVIRYHKRSEANSPLVAEYCDVEAGVSKP